MTDQHAETRAPWMVLAELAAEAEGKMFVVGVRPNGKGWFANCGGVEWDGDGPDTAVQSVVRALAGTARQAAISAGADFKALEQRAIDLADTAALIDAQGSC